MATAVPKPVKRLIAISLATVLLVTLAACESSSSGEGQMNAFSVGSSPVVTVTVGNGDVDLVVGPAGEIKVKAELEDAKNVEYEASQTGDTITVEAKTKSGGKADVTLTLPETTRFEITTGSGDLDVAGIQAPGQVSSGSGSITFERYKGDVIGNTGSGNINLTDVTGFIMLNDGSGNITLKGATGSFGLNTGSGNISIRGANGAFLLNTGSGDISFQGELAAGSDNKLSVGSGSVTVELAGSPSVTLDLETDDGNVTVDLPATAREESKERFVGTIGTGDAALNIRVGNGNITIK